MSLRASFTPFLTTCRDCNHPQFKIPFSCASQCPGPSPLRACSSLNTISSRFAPVDDGGHCCPESHEGAKGCAACPRYQRGRGQGSWARPLASPRTGAGKPDTGSLKPVGKRRRRRLWPARARPAGGARTQPLHHSSTAAP